jgi:hypothetical protein
MRPPVSRPPVLRSFVLIALLLTSALFALPGQAGPAQGPFTAAQFRPSEAVAPDTLDGYRGGFITDNGLEVSLGIERIVTINGDIAERSELQFGDLGRLTSGASTLSAQAAGQLSLIRNGADGLAVQLGAAGLGATVIQNSLNNQMINQATIINASVNAQGMLQAMHFQSTLANALNTAVTGR